MRVGLESFRILDDLLNSVIGSISCRMINIDTLNLYVEWGYILRIHSNNILSDLFQF